MNHSSTVVFNTAMSNRDPVEVFVRLTLHSGCFDN